jgi:hypothetical protein
MACFVAFFSMHWRCCGLAARSRQIDRQRDTCEFVGLPSQGGQSVWVERVILVTAIKREPCSPTGYLSRRNPPFHLSVISLVSPIQTVSHRIPIYFSLFIPLFVVVAFNRSASTTACSGVHWRALACTGVLWRALACSGENWRALACIELLWRALACSSGQLRALTCTGVL